MNRATFLGLLAIVTANLTWGLAPMLYKSIAHIPPVEVFAHRGVWALVFLLIILTFQSRLGELRQALTTPRLMAILMVAALMIAANWYAFIWAIQAGRLTESSLGYFIFPLVAVTLGRVIYGEQLLGLQKVAVALVTLAVLILAIGTGAPPWLALFLAGTFGLYSMIKKRLTIGPMLSVAIEVLILLPFFATVIAKAHLNGQGHFAGNTWDSFALILSGPVSAVPLMFFSFATQHVRLATVGLLQYINPTVQFLVATLIFAEPFTEWHGLAFPIIWFALAVYTFAALRQDRRARKAASKALAEGMVVTNSSKERSAKP